MSLDSSQQEQPIYCAVGNATLHDDMRHSTSATASSFTQQAKTSDLKAFFDGPSTARSRNPLHHSPLAHHAEHLRHTHGGTGLAPSALAHSAISKLEPSVPKASRTRGSAAAIAVQPPEQHEWFQSMAMGVAAMHADSRVVLAQAVFRQRKSWKRDDLDVLATVLIDYVVEGPCYNMERAARFTCKLYEFFRHDKGHDRAAHFKRRIEEHVYAKFAQYCVPLSICQSNSTNSAQILYSTAPAPSVDPRSEARARSAAHLAALVGELFADSMVSSWLILYCLNSLAAQTYVLEHLEAMQDLLSHAGHKLYEAPASDYWDKFTVVVQCRADGLLKGAGVADKAEDCDKAKGLVQKIRDNVEEWRRLSSCSTSDDSSSSTLVEEDDEYIWPPRTLPKKC